MKTYESLERVKEGLKELIDTKIEYLKFLQSLPAKTDTFRQYLNHKMNETVCELRELKESYDDFRIMTGEKV